YLQGEMIDVAGVLSGRRAAELSERPVDRHDVDERCAGAQLNEADGVLALLDLAADNVGIKRERLLKVADSQDDMVDLLEGKGRHVPTPAPQRSYTNRGRHRWPSNQQSRHRRACLADAIRSLRCHVPFSMVDGSEELRFSDGRNGQLPY